MSNEMKLLQLNDLSESDKLTNGNGLFSVIIVLALVVGFLLFKKITVEGE